MREQGQQHAVSGAHSCAKRQWPLDRHNKKGGAHQGTAFLAG